MENIENFRVVYVTTNSNESAKEISRVLVNEHLAACCSIIPNVTSVYMWNNTPEESSEFLIMIKTTVAKLDILMQRVTELHPYDVPEIIALPITQAAPLYAQWMREMLE